MGYLSGVTPAAAEALARRLIDRHAPGWKFAWHRGLVAAGSCEYATRTIKLSRPITEATPAKWVEATLRHELAHALTEEEKAHHGPLWRKACRALGTPARVGLTKEERAYRRRAVRATRGRRRG